MLSDTHIADICRRAGFFGEHLVTAIACALAASGGKPNYDHRIDPGPVAHYKGLWGLDVIDWPEHAITALDDPHTAAAVAHELVDDTGGWGWCPAWRSGASDVMLPRARVAHTVYAATEQHLDPVHAGPALEALARRKIAAQRQPPTATALRPLGR